MLIIEVSLLPPTKSLSDISVISKYFKNCSNIDLNNIQNAHISQSKLYLNILDIPHFIEGTNTPINFGVVELIIKSTHVFNNIKIASKPCVVKVSPKPNIAIIWINIWYAQSSSSAKHSSLSALTLVVTLPLFEVQI